MAAEMKMIKKESVMFLHCNPAHYYWIKFIDSVRTVNYHCTQ